MGQEEHTPCKEVRGTSAIPDVADHDRDGVLDNTDMTPEDYRKAIRNDDRWDVLAVYRHDRGKTAYYQLSDDERKRVDLMVDMALDSL